MWERLLMSILLLLFLIKRVFYNPYAYLRGLWNILWTVRLNIKRKKGGGVCFVFQWHLSDCPSSIYLPWSVTFPAPLNLPTQVRAVCREGPPIPLWSLQYQHNPESTTPRLGLFKTLPSGIFKLLTSLSWFINFNCEFFPRRFFKNFPHVWIWSPGWIVQSSLW